MEKMRQAAFVGLQDLSIAYNSISIFYDPWEVQQKYGLSPGDFVLHWLEEVLEDSIDDQPASTGKAHLIPVCYESAFAPDLVATANYLACSIPELIALHTAQSFHVFMVGFSPGFPYLGILPPQLQVPRKATPALRVEPGSVGIAALQTGIYPAATSGGWNIIGRTPMKVFDAANPAICLLKAGDTVQFTAIDAGTFAYLNQYENP